MSENESQYEHSIRAIYGLDGEAYVEDHRIRPQTVQEDRLEMSLLMRIGGPYGAFYLRAESTFTDGEDEGHHVEIRRRGGDVVDEFDVDWTTAAPYDTTDATQALHETFIGSAHDWYSHAVAAEEAGDDGGEPADASGVCRMFTPDVSTGDFGYVCPRCDEVNALEGDPMEFANVPFDCTECGYVALLDGGALAAFDAQLRRMESETCPEIQAARRIHDALHAGVEPGVAVEQSVEAVDGEEGEQANILETTRGREDIWMVSWGGADLEVTTAEDGKLWMIEVTDSEGTIAKSSHNDEEFPTVEEAGGQR